MQIGNIKIKISSASFTIDSAEALNLQDQELSELLTTVYVGGGYADQETAETLFEAETVRKRGRIIVARENYNSALTGMVINVTASSPECRFAKENEIEMHLLAVKSEFRGNGLGKMLIEASIDDARENGCCKIVLWTQKTMTVAHRLYESTGFVHTPEKDFSRNNRNFLFYERLVN